MTRLWWCVLAAALVLGTTTGAFSQTIDTPPVLACPLFSLTPYVPAGWPGYSCVFIPSPNGITPPYVNNAGQVATAMAPNGPSPRGLLYDNGEIRTFEIPGATRLIVAGLNNHGHVAGTALIPDPAGVEREYVFIWTDGPTRLAPVPLDPLCAGTSFHISGLNDSDVIVGREFYCGHNYRYDGNWSEILGPPAPAVGLEHAPIQVGNITSNGEIGAVAYRENSDYRGAILEPDGSWRVLSDPFFPPPDSPAVPMFVRNERGDVFGYRGTATEREPTLRLADGTIIPLQFLVSEPGLGTAYHQVTPNALNNRGEIVGTLDDANSGEQGKAVLYSGGQFSFLPTPGTPTGINDHGMIAVSYAFSYPVPGAPGVLVLTPCVDGDEDALCDDWEENGVYVDNPAAQGATEFVDLPRMGARPDHKDIFVHVDGVAGAATLTSSILAPVVKAFADAPVHNPDGSTGITLHVDCGGDCLMDPDHHLPWADLSRATTHGFVPWVISFPDVVEPDGMVTHATCEDQSVDDWSVFERLKQQGFPFERNGIFHYAIVAPAVDVTFDGDGVAQRCLDGLSRGVPASDFAVGPENPTAFNLAHTFMHELGHNLGLFHGGGDLSEAKPNYLSIMNPLFAQGLVVDGQDQVLDYSRFALPALDEHRLDEASGLDAEHAAEAEISLEAGITPNRYSSFQFCDISIDTPDGPKPGTLAHAVPSDGAIDWNCNGFDHDADIAVNVNPPANDGLSTLASFNDWLHLNYRGGTITRIGTTSLPLQMPAVQETSNQTAAQMPLLFGVSVSGPPTITLAAGGTQSFTLQIANTGVSDDTYHLTISDTSGFVNAPSTPTILDVPAESTRPLPISLNVPSGLDTFITITVVSGRNPARSATFVVHATAAGTVGGDPGGGGGDTTAPNLTLPAPITVDASGPAGTVVTYAVRAADAHDGDRPVSCNPASGTTFPVGMTMVTCEATDIAGNVAEGSFTVTVHDGVPPATTASLAPFPNANGWINGAATLQLNATDNASGVQSIGYALSGPQFGNTVVLGATATVTVTADGITDVTFNATDVAGNAELPQHVTVRVDHTAPALFTPPDMILEAQNASGAFVTFTVTANDNMSGVAAVHVDRQPGNFPVGVTSVSASAEDYAGNTSSAQFTVTVRDTQPPMIFLPPATMAYEATSPAGALVRYFASAQDSVDGALTPVCSPASNATFPIGDTNVSCSAVDSSGNSATQTFRVTVADTTAPMLGVPNSQTREASSASGAVVTYTATANDAVDGPVPVTCNPASGALLPFGPTTVTCSAVDSRGNLRTASFVITVDDTTAPFLSLPNSQTREAFGPNGAVVTYSASARDTVDGAVVISCNPASQSTYAVGPTTVNCSASDSHGNRRDGSFTITVQDTTAPLINVPMGLTLPATSSAGAIVSFAHVVSAHDLVDGAITPTCSPTSSSTFAIGMTTVSCNATDAHGNQSAKTFQVQITDRPTLQLPSDILAEATTSAGAHVTFSVTAHSFADGPLPVQCFAVMGFSGDQPLLGNAVTSGTMFALGTTSIDCAATSSSHDTQVGLFRVTVVDTKPPTVLTSGPVSVAATSPSGAIATFTATANDDVDGPLPTRCTPSSGSLFAIGLAGVTCTAIDAHGNVGAATFVVTVLGPSEVTQMLITEASNIGLRSAVSLLNNVLASLTRKNTMSACGQLQAFINMIGAPARQAPTAASAAELIAQATAARGALDCR